MIELVMVACLTATPAECREIRLGGVEGVVDQLSCRRMGMLEAARWAGDHPDWTIRSYRCGPPRQDV